MATSTPSFHYPNVHRKPVPALHHDTQYLASSPAPYAHSRTRTTSSNVLPMAQPGYPTQTFTSRRTPSTGTFSTIASSSNGPAMRQPSTELRRSTSSRSGASMQPQGYVALMRKQKATVWCDRAQHEDPRMVAAQRQAKIRAALEVSGAAAGKGGRVTAKVRNHGKAVLVGYNPGDLVVGGVPMRLSATEVEGGDSDEDEYPRIQHRRTGSGRSSVGSGRRGLTYARQSGRWSNTPPNERDRHDSTTSAVEEAKAVMQRSGSGASGSSSERADTVGDLNGDAARLASNNLLKSTLSREKSTRNPEELRRRGSVDERTMTMKMSAGRLFVANPDADSD